MSTISEHLQATRGNYKDDERAKWVKDCASELGVSIRTVRNNAVKFWPCGPSFSRKGMARKPAIDQKAFRSLSEEDLRRKHDNAFRLREAAEKLIEGEYILENDFVSTLNIRGGYKYIVERPEFEKYRGKASGDCWYWSHPKSIMKLKNERILQ